MSATDPVRRVSTRAEPNLPRRVLLLTESSVLGAMLVELLDGTATLARVVPPRQALQRGGLDDADTVVLDLPPEGSDALLAQLRLHYRGELVVLADGGPWHGGAAEPAWTRLTRLTRPFSADELRAALGVGPEVARPRVPVADHPAPPALASAADLKAAARRAPSWAQVATGQPNREGFEGHARSRLAALTQGWQARRRIRVAGFSAFALIAFTVAFILAANGRCGPGCDALGTAFSPEPTIAASESSAPSATRPKRAPDATAAPVAGTPGPGGLRGVSGARLPTTIGERATTTSRKPDLGGAGPTPASAGTQPPTTPSTTAPPTSVPTTTTAPPVTTTDPPPTT